MWLIVLLIITPHPMPQLEHDLSGFRFATNRACMAEAVARTNALAKVGVHGRFMCMMPDEPDDLLAREPYGAF